MSVSIVDSEQPESRAPARHRQLALFPGIDVEPWVPLSTPALRLNEDKYGLIRECYQEVFDSFLPGSKGTPFFTQVAEQLRTHGLDVSPQALTNLIQRARRLGIDHFPDPRQRAIPSSSPRAKKLRTPSAPVRLSQQEHNAFAKIYRDLLSEGYPKKKKDKGFFQEAASRMKHQGYTYSNKQLALYASYRRRIGDVNFPRLRGSHELDRMQVAAVDRMRALGVMATGLMHEILQPLQIILGDAELQKRELANSTINSVKLSERLERIITQANKLSRVVQHVRTIAGGGEPKPGPVDLREALENALALFMEQLKSRGIQVDLSGISADLPAVKADSVAVERIFINLLTNARDAIEDTGRNEGTINISARRQDQVIICEVSDNGTGIVEENLERIFDPYFSTKDVGKGTGMGLTEVMNLMIQFGGRITVQSTLNQSTRFTLEFQQYVDSMRDP